MSHPQSPYAAPALLAEELPPLSKNEARAEAERCLYCFDAPCVQACPTHIDIPGFIRKLQQNRAEDAGRRILEANLLGASCSRVCPVKELCEGACVRNDMDQPVQIGRLQRHATDSLLGKDTPVFAPAPRTGKKVAVIGSGPAGLSCAGELARKGHGVTVFERRALPGGLSAHGIITLREPLEVALAEVDLIRNLGVHIEMDRELGRNLSWSELEEDFDAVFLAIGLGSVPLLGIPGDRMVRDGLAFLEESKLDPEGVQVGKNVLVIGAGNTAIDCATVAKRLGAAEVTIVYRRNESDMSAYAHEYEFALKEGIRFEFMTMPEQVLSLDGKIRGLRCVRTTYDSPDSQGGKRSIRAIPEAGIDIPCDMIVAAIGQTKPLHTASDSTNPGKVLGTDPAFHAPGEGGYLKVGKNFMTERQGVFAGGDCIRSTGEATTVMAVQDGKMAAWSIHHWLGNLTQKA